MLFDNAFEQRAARHGLGSIQSNTSQVHFQDFDIPQVIQRAVVGGTLCTLVWLAVQFLVRPTGSIGWYRARTRELLRARHGIARDVTEAEASLTILRGQLGAAPEPPPVRPSPASRPTAVASMLPPQREDDLEDSHLWLHGRGA